MIIVTHNNQQVLRVFSEAKQTVLDFSPKQSIIEVLYAFASQNPESLLVWQHESLAEQLDLDYIANIPAIHKKVLSFSSNAFLPPQIGYVEQSPFIAVNKKVCYPTWQMSGQVGCIKASNLLQFQYVVNDTNFSYALCSIAKLAMPQGLWCYSDPKLVQSDVVISEEMSSIKNLFKFVKQHYKSVWVGLLFLNLLIYEKQWTLFSVLGALSLKRRLSKFKINDTPLELKSSLEPPSIDVIIPTIGRANYLYNVLKDLTKQTVLPKKVIVVEQNPEPGDNTQLPFIQEEEWPFQIKHHFIQQTGVCNARNLALKSVTSEFVYLADDDNVFEANLIQNALNFIQVSGTSTLSMSYLQKDEIEKIETTVQWPTFGGGCSIISSELLKSVKFDLALEHGYGEDVDFGMQLRKAGADIIYHPNLKILHLKAPVGGFRTTFKQPWTEDALQPKPSPTVLYSMIKHQTKEQILGYKTLLFIKFYTKQSIKNPIKYHKVFKKRWTRSLYWVEKIKHNF
ncbi:glycosyltransferase [Tamlana sp. 2_MG-2023]|uniref:glycosyltransferase family 2 protein n=1 Tax=unclassified Tamlana TaxID=2614803 RepID=UPI0026E1CB82|nr:MULTISPECIES: glycosyltransferase [unclassified Tamlana]MDO6758764.1 glycosyltransferase [Tamlana sp. 2_MG-2023]MDO6789463.1 glycosyltransferase [Tamlana sp. 1_MG-2023]